MMHVVQKLNPYCFFFMIMTVAISTNTSRIAHTITKATKVAENFLMISVDQTVMADGNAADGNAADGNAADGNAADGNAADGNATDGNAADGRCTYPRLGLNIK